MKHNKEVLLDNTGWRNPLEGVDIGEVYIYNTRAHWQLRH